MIILSSNETRARMYEIAREHCRPLFPTVETDLQTVKDQNVPAPIVDGQATVDVEALIAAAEKEMLAAVSDRFAALRAAARATSPADAPSDAGLNDLVRPMMILQAYDISRAELHRRCVEHPIGTPGGFSLRRDGESSHLISLSRWDRHFAQNPPRKRRSETKKRVK